MAERIRRRLLGGFVITAAGAAAAIVFSLLAYSATDQAYSDILSDSSHVQELVASLGDAIVAEVLHARAFLITGDEQSITSRDLAHRDFERAYADLRQVIGRLSETSARVLQDVSEVHTQYDALVDELIELHRAGQAEAAVKLFDARSDPLVLKLLAGRRSLRADIQARVIEVNREFSTRSGQIILFVAVVFLMSVVGSIWLSTRLLAPPLQELAYFEGALTETAHAGARHLVRLPRSASGQPNVLFRAYNALIARLEESETRRLDFVGMVAHELRSPLGSILGYAEVVEDRAASHSDADLQSYGRIILTQAERMGQMLDNLLTAAAIEENRLDVILAPVPLSVLLSEVVVDARRQSGREITFENALDSAVMHGDPLHVRKVFVNLIDNAVKFSAPSTPIHISARRAPTPGWGEVTVADCGIGIAQADLPLLFQRFGRIKNEQTRGIPGVGLGLYIVKHLVQRHRGHVTAHSQPGQGTAFVVRLPLEVGLFTLDEEDTQEQVE